MSRSLELRQCPKGYYCQQGNKACIDKQRKSPKCLTNLRQIGNKYVCPSGYYCPTEGLPRPISCRTVIKGVDVMNITCHVPASSEMPGLISPQSCPSGRVCPVTYLQGLAVSAGFANTVENPGM